MVALGKDGSAKGQIYLDDGEGYGYSRGEFVWRSFRFTPSGKAGRGGILNSADMIQASGGFGLTQINKWEEVIGHVRVEKVVILGIERPGAVKIGSENVEWSYIDGVAQAAREKEGQESWC